MSFFKRIFAGAVLILLGLGVAAYGDWKIKTGVEGRWTFDSNVFNLSATQIDAFNLKGPAEAKSGRYTDMDRVGDHIFRPVFFLKAGGPGLSGKKLDVELSLNYEIYAANSRKTNFEVNADLKQALWNRGNLKIGGRYVPSMFRKNYLIDGVPLRTGVVPPQNRVYGPGVHSEAEGTAAYEHRLLTKKQTGAFGLTVQVGAGLYDRSYKDVVFRGRDRNVLSLDVDLSMDFENDWVVDLDYTHEKADSPLVTEVLLLDEPYFLVDFNRDGDLRDHNVRREDTVDRSFKANRLEGRLTVPLGSSTDLRLSVTRRIKTFLSEEPYDGYQGRKDKRWVLGAEFEHRWSGNLSLTAGYRYYNQKSNLQDLTEDEDDYLKHVVWAELSFGF